MVTPHTGPLSTIDGRRQAGDQAQADLPMPKALTDQAQDRMLGQSVSSPAQASPKIITRERVVTIFPAPILLSLLSDQIINTDSTYIHIYD